MSSNETHMINLSNYEEYFVLYMDNELSAEEKQMVDNFIAEHPQLREELEMLLSTRLPMDEISFGGKEELLSPSMKVATVDEALLLYIDNELPAPDRKKLEEKLTADKDYAQQHNVLMQTKLDASEKVLHPNKKELYRYAERVVAFKTWMRIAAAVVLLLFGSLFFLVNNNKPSTITDTTASTAHKQNTTPVTEDKLQTGKKTIIPPQSHKEGQQLADKITTPRTTDHVSNPVMKQKDSPDPVTTNDNAVAHQPEERKREVVKFDVKQFTQPDIDINAVKETLAHNAVTSDYTNRNTLGDTPIEPAVPDGDFKETKKSSAKGLFRKVTRFIGRNTGIGTADVGDEVLIGAVALKLK